MNMKFTFKTAMKSYIHMRLAMQSHQCGAHSRSPQIISRDHTGIVNSLVPRLFLVRFHGGMDFVVELQINQQSKDIGCILCCAPTLLSSPGSSSTPATSPANSPLSPLSLLLFPLSCSSFFPSRSLPPSSIIRHWSRFREGCCQLNEWRLQEGACGLASGELNGCCGPVHITACC